LGEKGALHVKKKNEILEQNNFFLIVEMCTNNVVESKIYR